MVASIMKPTTLFVQGTFTLPNMSMNGSLFMLVPCYGTSVYTMATELTKNSIRCYSAARTVPGMVARGLSALLVAMLTSLALENVKPMARTAVNIGTKLPGKMLLPTRPLNTGVRRQLVTGTMLNTVSKLTTTNV